MELASADYRWVAGALRLLELKYGPFWEPARPLTAVRSEAVLETARSMEALLGRLVAGRRKSALIIVSVGVLVVGAFAVLPVLTERIGVLAAGLVPAVWGSVSAWLWYWYWREWFFYGSFHLPPSPPAPTPNELVDVFRQMSDQLSGLEDVVPAAAVLAMRDIAPMSFEACMRLTITGSSTKRDVRAAQQRYRADGQEVD